MNHFEMSEFFCKCGCGQHGMHPKFLEMLCKARDSVDIRFDIASGYRCREHNADAGGSPTSSHMRGYAADIKVYDDEKRYIITKALLMAGFTRIGQYRTFIHVDCDPEKNSCRMWYS